MIALPFRNPAGGLVDRARPLAFTFDGRPYRGCAGDTLASALLANGVRIVGRSFKYHRPRGIVGLGVEEPNALVTLGEGARAEPNTKATQVELFEGLTARSQNCWPSVAFDLGATAGLLGRLIPAGFYYKTFMWPRRWWMGYEYLIRRAAGLGQAPTGPDPDSYEHRHAHCDVLVVGAGPAGLAAAAVAAEAHARVILVEDAPEVGGMLRGSPEKIAGRPAAEWIAETMATLRLHPDTTVLTRATAFGYYDHNQMAVIERVADHRPAGPGEPRQRVWHVHAREVVLATGAHERSIVFGNNDRPGVMLTSAAHGYLSRYGVRAGHQAIVFTNNDSAYPSALALSAGGIRVRAVVDVRGNAPEGLVREIEAAGIEHLPRSAVLHASGARAVRSAFVASIEDRPRGPAGREIPCDLICVSGGWNPAVQLHAQARGRPVYDADLSTFVPGPSVQAERSAGAARGIFDLPGCLRDGAAAGTQAAVAAGFGGASEREGQPPAKPPASWIEAFWAAPRPGRGRPKRFVDLQGDVTDSDVALAVREGYRSVEHVKRYTTLGMGTDQGKTSNVLGLGRLADVLGTEIAGIGTTTFRPPYVPVALGALAGLEGGRHFLPQRLTPMHGWHVEAGAVMYQSGPWWRPQCYPQPGESIEEAGRREALNVRRRVGLLDVSTLGKIELFGTDAAEFLERIYVNRWHSLTVGKSRYGVMLREDGIVFDDGTTTRIGPSHFLMTTTTDKAQTVARRLDYYHKVFWPDLNVHLVTVTDQWAAIAVAGPESRRVLARVVDGLDGGLEALPFMGFGTGRVDGTPVRVFRISFSGELAYEIYVRARDGTALWTRLMEAGRDFGIAPYGIDASSTLRIEKGHVAGAELDGRTTADDLGLGRMMKADRDFIGRRSLSRPALGGPSRWQLVGLVPADGSTPLPRGAKIVGPSSDGAPYIGELTSTTWSPILDMPIGLALIAGGRSRHGETVVAASPLAGQNVRAVVRSPAFFDPEGERQRG